ncbi:hypothetical protein [uncultured Desulfosarcina sp.]|uniref:hypothetical protein n=1 Tax=uncultured Desulfosarcina sp. TaxID=218289 RepID=UPI0029C8537B|nr:hypothetical protein [uncultured Desulfosarcina sp.]
MNDFENHKWPAVVFFLTCGLFFFGCVWYLWVGARNPEYYWHPSPTLTGQPADRVLEKNASILLEKNHGARVDSARIVYRGSCNGTLHMDLYVLQLDPHYGYPHQVEEDQARKGFRMGEYYFQVLASSDGKISLKRL